jgi:hypothetical protein
MMPAGLVVVLCPAIAIVLVPVTTAARRSTKSALIHELATLGEPASGLPLTQTSTVSSPVTTSWASVIAPAATLNVLRK